MIGRLRGPAGSSVRLRLQRKNQAIPLDVAVVREPIKTILEVRAEEGKLVIDAIGGRQAFEFDLGKPIAVIPQSDSAFYVDGRYHTQIVFTKDASGRVTGAILNPGPWEQKRLENRLISFCRGTILQASHDLRSLFEMTLIETARLRLRPRVREDVEPIVSMDSDPDVRRFIGGPLDPDIHCREVLANIACERSQHWAWAIERKDRTGFVGMCLLRPLEGTPFICTGWRLRREHWGQGFATEASHAVLDQALQVLRIDPVVAIVDPRNTASIRVAQKIGMQRMGTVYHYGTEQILFRADAADFN